MTPRPGDFVVFRSSHGWAARLIQIGTVSRYNHAAIYVGSGAIIEAQPGGVRMSALADYEGTYVVSRMDMTEWERTKVCRYARKAIGTKYGWLDIAALALVAFGFRPAWLDNYAARDDRLVCSQLVANAYTDAALRLGDVDPWTVTPGDLADLITTGKYL